METNDTHSQCTAAEPLQPKESIQVEDISRTEPPPPIWLSKRFLVALLLFLANILYSLGCQVMSIAIVDMTTNKSIITGNLTIIEAAEFQWDSITVGMILNMFLYGFLFTPLGGYLSHKFGGAKTLGVSMMMEGLSTLFTPYSLYINFYLFLAFRVFVGLFQSFCGPSDAEIFAKWIPKQERPTVMSYVINGMYLGSTITYPFCGFIAYVWGWPMTFYVTGTICIIWSLLWMILVTNDPSKDRWISEKELLYIKQGTESAPTRHTTRPYKDIFTSSSFWALSISKISYSWGTSFIVGYIPIYIRDVTGRNINEVGLLSSIPNAITILTIPLAGMLMDHWQKRSNLKGTMIHKIVLGVGFLWSSFIFVIIALMSDFIASMIGFSIIRIILSFNRIVSELITICMAPNHSSLVSGLTLFVQMAGGIAAQSFIGYVVQNHKTQEWNICFLWSAGILVLITAIYMIYGSSEPQPWSVSTPRELNYNKTC